MGPGTAFPEPEFIKAFNGRTATGTLTREERDGPPGPERHIDPATRAERPGAFAVARPVMVRDR